MFSFLNSTSPTACPRCRQVHAQHFTACRSAHLLALAAEHMNESFDPYLAWLGDAMLCLDVRRGLGSLQGQLFIVYTSNAFLAAFLTSHHPDLLPARSNVSVKRAGQIFEHHYYLSPTFRSSFLSTLDFDLSVFPMGYLD